SKLWLPVLTLGLLGLWADVGRAYYPPPTSLPPPPPPPLNPQPAVYYPAPPVSCSSCETNCCRRGLLGRLRDKIHNLAHGTNCCPAPNCSPCDSCCPPRRVGLFERI